jgi:nucleoside-diphosphate-sugar epimerase
MAFIHVRDAARALIEAAQYGDGWHVVNAAPEVATIGQVARTVERLAGARGLTVRIDGATDADATFEVRSRLRIEPQWELDSGLPEVLDYFRMHE